jgi:hypothetical protein
MPAILWPSQAAGSTTSDAAGVPIGKIVIDQMVGKSAEIRQRGNKRRLNRPPGNFFPARKQSLTIAELAFRISRALR